MTRRWLPAALLCGIVYYAAGVGFAALAAEAPSLAMRTVWRLAAWVVCAAAFAVHVGYEHFRLRHPSGRAALHAALAVALGGFLLALRVNIAPSPATRRSFALLALVLWPLITAVPAYLVAFAAVAVLRRWRRAGP